MKLRSGWIILVAALPFVSLQTACGESERSAQETSATGTLRLRLTGQSSAGHAYCSGLGPPPFPPLAPLLASPRASRVKGPAANFWMLRACDRPAPPGLSLPG